MPSNRKRTRKRVVSLALIAFCLLGALLLWGVPRYAYPVRYSLEVEQYAKAYDLPVALVYAVIRTESHFQADAVSDRGAIGLMQLTPIAVAEVTRQTGMSTAIADLVQADTNLRFGCCYLSLMYQRFGNWATALAAYNAGPTVVASWLSDPRYAENGCLKHIPYAETEAYVTQVQSAQRYYERKLN